jgi:hypothetical protein
MMPCYTKEWPRTVGDITAKQLRRLILDEQFAGPCAIGGIRPHTISLSTVIVNGYMYTDDSFYYFNCLNTGVIYAIVYGDLPYIRSLTSTRETLNMGPETTMERSPLKDSLSRTVSYGAKASSRNEVKLA